VRSHSQKKSQLSGNITRAFSSGGWDISPKKGENLKIICCKIEQKTSANLNFGIFSGCVFGFGFVMDNEHGFFERLYINHDLFSLLILSFKNDLYTCFLRYLFFKFYFWRGC